MMDAAKLIDLGRYPILDPEGRARVVAAAREGIAREGLAQLPGFVTPAGVAAMRAEALALAGVSHRRDRMLRAYSEPEEDWMEADHPVRRVAPYRMRVAATDQMEAGGATLAIFEWTEMVALVRDMLGMAELHPVADPLMRCNFTYLGAGDEHGWHFDGNDFVVSLMIQNAERGGDFEFAPEVRDEDNPNYDAVREVMDGGSPRLRSVRAEPGTLALFRGRRALHRVSRVEGARERIIALLSYDRRPGMVWGPDAQRRVFARAAGEPVVA